MTGSFFRISSDWLRMLAAVILLLGMAGIYLFLLSASIV